MAETGLTTFTFKLSGADTEKNTDGPFVKFAIITLFWSGSTDSVALTMLSAFYKLLLLTIMKPPFYKEDCVYNFTNVN